MEGTDITSAENPAVAMSSDIVVSLKYDGLFQALSSASGVRSHLDYYRWLQSEINDFIPHRGVLATWGSFETGELSFDLASSIEGDTTQNLHQVKGLGRVMNQLFRRVHSTGRSWMVLKDLHAEARAYGLDLKSDYYRTHLAYARALLVYIMRCERGGHDCMYLFSMTEDKVKFDPMVLDLMMPHVDSALRRVKCLATAQETGADDEHCPLSDREHEVLNWVSQGKSNEEIGTILGISRNTVKNHLKRIFAKMGVTARSQAVRVYLENRVA